MLSNLYSEIELFEPNAFLGLLPEFSRAITWLIKHHIEQGNAISESDTASLFAASKTCSDWQAQLHLLQIAVLTNCRPELLDMIRDTIQAGLKSERPFLRAWAFEAEFLRVQFQQSELKKLAVKIESVLPLEKASVKAKLRKISEKIKNLKS
ncbi:MAG: hypothetical protein KDK38_07675 [Leptospiraceae bacterium]|nr:hypothetical protein [Leptospiraceae bacterium]